MPLIYEIPLMAYRILIITLYLCQYYFMLYLITLNITYSNLPFAFGIDFDGNYGYVKDGADTVTPFKRGSLKQITTATLKHVGEQAAFPTTTMLVSISTSGWGSPYCGTWATRESGNPGLYAATITPNGAYSVSATLDWNRNIITVSQIQTTNCPIYMSAYELI
ncbi:hypothetical protein D7X88_19550 [bacterium C-53]|nr:hypothetical protein [Lachnospiraceae bacterium]NBI02190.1 hypothetical protein [Lachnospiraceae bacterium]RKJ06736.1 hypothetical protein D7X88_19550 [bacterium C-53]